MDVKQFIFAAEKRPLMYVRNLCLNEFLIYLDAMLSTKRMYKIEDNFDKEFSNNFPTWICNKFNFPEEYSSRWEHIIFLQSNNNEDALINFFKYFREFCNSIG
jgi:hypothetical protein